jgi:pimeloyl-ACP methyl ester carboxylesterase
MPELGHFPHAEDPEAFAPYLRRAIARIGDAVRID